MRILVVDDEVRLTRHVASALTEADHDPVVVHDGEAALQTARLSKFDLIILDVGLPGVDGFQVLRRLRALHISTRVIMLTARGELSDRVTGLQLGADDYLPKPFAMQELLARVRALSRRFAEEPALELRSRRREFEFSRPFRAARPGRDRAFHARADVVESVDARAGTRLHADGIVRARVGTRTRV
ncbi:MAG TPA: response regulator [Chthoniobacterales bacterium]|nr:response regulator [Chthoniobacterales bacterium]